MEALGHDADDRVALAIEHHGLSDYVGVGPEPLPQSIADNHDALARWRIFFFREAAAQCRIDSQHAEEIDRDFNAGHVLGLIAARQVDA